MLKSVEKNKKYIFWMLTFGLFGLAGLLLAPVVMYIIKVSKRHPKALGWITITALAFICIYGFLFKKEWDTSYATICIVTVIAIGSVLDTNRR